MIKLKYVKKTKAEKELLKKKIAHLGLTYCSKLFIKLTSKVVIPDLYLFILKYEYDNRTNDDIKKILPKIMNLKRLNEYLKFIDNKKNNNYNNILIEIAKISFYNKKKKYEILKRANEDIEKFYFVFNGSLSKLTLTFIKEKISIEEYLIYIIKMNLLNEKQILNKCNILNKSYINIDINNFNNFFKENKEYDYKQLLIKAKNELISEGFKISKNKIEIISIDNYLNIGKFKIKERNDIYANTRFYLYIGQYVKNRTVEKGDFIGDLSNNENKEGNTYICEESCDISYINKIETMKSEIYLNIYHNYKALFMSKINKFFIFKDFLEKSNYDFEKNIIPYLSYRSYKKGEKIITQESQYEGVFFILDGEVKITISKTFNELSNTLISLQYSIFNFKDYVSKIIKTVDILNEFHLKYMTNTRKKTFINLGENKIKSDILSSNRYLDFLKGKKYIELYNLGVGDILGMNELFDYKTELYNFSAVCLSKEAHLFFISKNHFSNIIEKEGNIMNNVIQLIDLKAKILIGKINNFKMTYSKRVLNNIKNNQNVLYNNYKNSNNKNKILNDMGNNEKSCFNTFHKINIKKLKGKSIKIINPNDVELFKKNDLFQYLQNNRLVRKNSLSDFFNINIGEALSRRNYKFLSPQYSKNNSFINNSKSNEITQGQTIKHNYSQIHLMNKVKNLNLNNNNTIVYKRNIKPLGDEGHLLINVFQNQKKYDELQKDNFYKSDYNINLSNNKELLPILNKSRNERNINYGNIRKKFGKTMSLRFLNHNRFKQFEN